MLTFNQLGNYGRLGNQMFQYATLYSVAKRLGFEFKIPNGNYELLKFNIIKKFLSEQDSIKYSYNEPFFHYSDKIFNIKDNTDIAGYFQSYKYFDDVKNDLIIQFCNDKINADCISIINNLKKVYKKQITSIHIRRADYLKYPDVHPTCTEKYYSDSVNYIGDSIFLIFSDDINWCKNVFCADNMLYITNEPIFDLLLMSNCDNNIISNSSFSWWAAYLNKNNSKKVIYPDVWFGKNGPQDIFDLIPSDWSLFKC